MSETAAPTRMAEATAPAIAFASRPDLSWSARATGVAGIEQALARIWSEAPDTAIGPDGEPHVVARTSVLNLVTVARRPELADRALDTFTALTGRHPSRSILIVTVDPDGPRQLWANVTARCLLPTAGRAAICTETIIVTAGGDAGSHLASIIPPLLVHDLPVALWWPGDVPFGRHDFQQLVGRALETDRLVVDGSGWSGDGMAGIRRLGAILDTGPIAVSDFALMRQSRWREAIASAFDQPALLPYLRSIRSLRVTYATAPDASAGTNVVRPLYHVAWLASRLGWSVVRPLRSEADGIWTAVMRRPRGEVAVTLEPEPSAALPPGSTLRMRIVAERRRSVLKAEVTARAEAVIVRARLDDRDALDRVYHAARRTDADLLAEAIESGGRDPVATAAIAMAAALAGPERAG